MEHAHIFCHGELSKTFKDLILKSYQNKKILVICGRTSSEKSGASLALSSGCQHAQVDYFDEFSSNPTLSEAVNAAAKLESYQPDLVIGLGGGSSIDMAKLALALSNSNVAPEALIRNNNLIEKNKTPFFAIPTTSGSGSEGTHFAVCYDESVKFSVADQSLMPTIALIDGDLTMSMPRTTAASSGLDALLQASESYWSKGATEESRDFSIKALNQISGSLTTSICNKTRYARYEMSEGAYWAGRAINIAKTTAAHAYSYHLSSNYSLDHGHAVAICMILLLKSIKENPSQDMIEKITEINKALGRENGISSYICFIEDLLEKFDLQTKLSQIGCETNERFQEFLAAVNLERLGNFPDEIDTAVMYQIFLEELK